MKNLYGKKLGLIEKAVAKTKKEEPQHLKWKHIDLRIPAEFLSQIDKMLKSKIGIKRTGWILQAMGSQLEKEKRETQPTKEGL